MKKIFAFVGCTIGLFSYALNASDHNAAMKEQAAQTKEDLSDAAYHAKEALYHAKEEVKDSASDAADSVREKAQESKEYAQEKINELVEPEAENASSYNNVTLPNQFAADNEVYTSQEVTQSSLRIYVVIPNAEENNRHIMTGAKATIEDGVLTIVVEKHKYKR